MLIEVNTPTWDKSLENSLVLVDKQQQPVLEVLSEEIAEVKFLKLNIDDNRYLSQQLSVRNIPTLVLYHNKIEIQRFVGVQSKNQLRDSLLKFVNN